MLFHYYNEDVVAQLFRDLGRHGYNARYIITDSYVVFLENTVGFIGGIDRQGRVQILEELGDKYLMEAPALQSIVDASIMKKRGNCYEI